MVCGSARHDELLAGCVGVVLPIAVLGEALNLTYKYSAKAKVCAWLGQGFRLAGPKLMLGGVKAFAGLGQGLRLAG